MTLSRLWPKFDRQWLVYEDEHLAVVDKPAGMLVQPAERGQNNDCSGRLRQWLDEQYPDGDNYVGVVQGLDHQASGLVVYSRRRSSNRPLAEQLKRGLRRRYQVAVNTSVRRLDGRRQTPQGEFEGQTIARRGSRCLLAVTTATSSQPVRRWLAALDAPLAGDRSNHGSAAHRLMLHVEQLTLVHPATGEQQTFTAKPPPDLSSWLADPDTPPPADDNELEALLHSAAQRRYDLAKAGYTNAFRLVNGAGDGLAGIVIDRYSEHFVVALTDQAASQAERILDAAFRLGPQGIYLKLPVKQANTIVDPRQEHLAPNRAVRGTDAPQPATIAEGDLEFEVQLGSGLATGIFLDQRQNRRRLRQLAAGQRVLNLFAYTGGFTVAAIHGSAKQTVTVDASASALRWAERNLAATGVDMQNHRLVRRDVFQWLRRKPPTSWYSIRRVMPV